MTTFNTGNTIGSTDARDRADNSENLDLAVNSLAQTFVDRLGVTRDTLEGIYQKSAYYRAGTFDAGYTLTNNRQTLAYGNIEYSWSGTFPKVVSTGSTPATSGGIGINAWVDRTQDTLRGELTNGGTSIDDLSKLNTNQGAGIVGFTVSQAYAEGTAGKKLQQVVSVEDFDIAPSLDWTPAFAAAFAYLNANGNGGVVTIKNGKRYPIETDMHVPEFCRIKGNGFTAASHSNLTNLLGTIPGLIVNTAASITLYGSASLHDVAVLRKGLVGFENSTSAFAGTGIKTAEGYDDQTIKEVVVLGFNRGIDCKSSQRVTIKDIKLDCINGVRISNSRDVSRFSNIHCWPYITVGGVGDDILYRDGVGIEASGGAAIGVDSVDWLTITDSFTFGYRVGLYLQNCMLPTINNFAADSYTGLSAGLRAGMSGIYISDYVTEPTIITPKLTGLQQNGILIDMHDGNTSEVCISKGVFKELVSGVHIVNGFVSLNGNRYSSLTYAYSVDNATSRIKGRSEHYDSTVTTPCYLTADTPFMDIDESCTAESDYGSSFFAGPGKSISFISAEVDVTTAYNLQNFSNYQELYTTTAKTISSINDKGVVGRTVILRNVGSSTITLIGSGFMGNKTMASNSTAIITRINSTQWIIS